MSTAASYQSAQDSRIYIGLGADTGVKEVKILWPSGITQVLVKPRIRELITIEESAKSTEP